MLSTGARIAPWPACLRCQLRLVLHHLRGPTHQLRRPLCRPFSANHKLREHGADRLGLLDDVYGSDKGKRSNGVFFRHFNPQGRIVGKPGRKQQQSSETLAIDSLGERSEVIVLRDVYEDEIKKEGHGEEHAHGEGDGEKGKRRGISAEELQAAMAETEATPDNQEVYASIDALRPQSPFLEEKEYDDLLHQIQESYNVDQLSRYLHTTFAARQSGRSSSIAVFRTSRWVPGRTPIHKRRLAKSPVAKRLTAKATKSQFAEKILRLGWELKIHSEEQEIGELEMQVLPWHMALLFDLQQRGQPMCTALLDSPLLVRTSEITPYRPSNIMRITARRQDAEEIARQLEQKLMRAGALTLRLDLLRPLMPERDRNKRWRDVFRIQDLRTISSTTQAIIDLPESGKAGIYSFHLGRRETAGRLLLSLLGLAESNVKSVTLEPEQRPKRRGSKATADATALIPVFSDAELHLRHRGKPWFRAAQPLRKQQPGTTPIEQIAGVALEPAVQSRLSDLLAHPTLAPYHKSPPEPTEGSYWSRMDNINSQPWLARLGLRLLPPTVSEPSQSTFLSRVPMIESLITHFVPTDSRPTNLQLFFYPSPLGRRGEEAFRECPKLCLTLNLPALELTRVSAHLHEQVVDIPLPALDTDIRLERNASFRAKSSIVAQDPAVQGFLDVLRASAASKQGVLRAPRELEFRLPSWLLEEAENGIQHSKRYREGTKAKSAIASENDVPVTYLFSHFEQRSGANFVPKDEVRGKGGALEGWPEELKLTLREIDGGSTVTGRRLEVSLMSFEKLSWESVAGAATVVSRLITNLGRDVKVSSAGKKDERLSASEMREHEKTMIAEEDGLGRTKPSEKDVLDRAEA